MRTPGRLLPCIILVLGFLAACMSITRADEVIELEPGFAKFVRLQKSFSTVSIGKPEVADVVSLQAQGGILLTGKTPGRTNIIALDETGNEIVNAKIVVGQEVAAPDTKKIMTHAQNNVHEYWAYRCTPVCERVEDKLEQKEAPPVTNNFFSRTTPTPKSPTP